MRESPKARQAYKDYLDLGQNRSLEKLVAEYEKRRQSDGEVTVPTLRLRTIEQWSTLYGWQARVQALADQAVAAAEAELLRRRTEALETGYANDFERVELLKRLAARLEADLFDPNDGRLWLPDAKWIGGEAYGREVTIERFNGKEVEQLRGVLDDLAKEKGERARVDKLEITLRQQAEQAARARGLDPSAVVAEVDRLLEEARHA